MGKVRADNVKEPPLLYEVLGAEEPDEKTPFVVDTEEKAVWASGKFIEASKRLERCKQLADSYKEKIDRWFENVVKDDLSACEQMKALLRPFVHREISQKKSKTLNLPNAKLSLRKGSGKVEVEDEALTVSFLRENHPDALLIVEPRMSKEAVKRLFQQGELVPGVKVVSGRE